jgi:uncharacterized membrane protein
MEIAQKWIELVVTGIEVLAVAIMVVFIFIATAVWLLHGIQGIRRTYYDYRTAVGQAILIGLELLVAADIVRTVALDLSLANIGTLGALVLVRTFLGWTLTVEIEGRWPWQKSELNNEGGKIFGPSDESSSRIGVSTSSEPRGE